MKKSFLSFFSLFMLCAMAAADDAEAVRRYEDGYDLYGKGDYYHAAKKFEEVEIEADSPLIRSNALRAQAGAWRMSGMIYREFQALEKLMTLYPEFADVAILATREYEIAESYVDGEREPAFWHLRWIPWLDTGDKGLEIFTQALAHAPFAEWAPKARMRRAWLLDQDGQKVESVEELRIVVRDYPHDSIHKYAMLSLANGLFDLAERGDGDGAHLREAHQVLRDFQKQYPDATENGWVRRRLLSYKDAQAKRLYEMAQYYRKEGRTDAAERYLAKVLIDYPDSESAPDSEEALAELDKSYVPDAFLPDAGSRLPRIHTYQIPGEASGILLNPGENGNHYMLMVPDLHLHPEDGKGEK
ncbi:MAG: outer membrane protein assembly factor BamD [Victivallaceae bacterium]|nr:outer membrane protein assembly factor BamD [Victivallaceae bacterium]